MTRRLNTTLGFYLPTFLKMYVGTTKSLVNLKNLNDDVAESTYLHEYTHFLQDISSVYGLSNICKIVDYMKFANGKVVSLPKGSFSTPILPLKNSPDNVHLNIVLSEIYDGNGEDDFITFKDHRMRNKVVTFPDGDKSVPFVEVDYEDSTGKPKTFRFGADCIVESMAYIVEKNVYSNFVRSPDIPYSSAEKLVELIYPVLGKDILNVLALCDASLYGLHPAQLFYESLIRIKKDGVTFASPNDIYSYIKQATLKFNGISDFDGLLRFVGNQAIQQMTRYFNDPYFVDTKKWITDLINEAVNLRLSNQGFIIDLAKGGKIGKSKEFENLILRLGTPLITNDTGEHTFGHKSTFTGNVDPFLLWATDQVHSVFQYGSRECEMIDACKEKGVNVDLRCSSAPWERATSGDWCHFSLLWNHWGLTGYSVK